MKYLSLFILSLISLFACKSPVTQQGGEGHSNHLINESSPYLLQHAYNPVDWYPWGESALNKASADNKLLVISIGYAACHWCHVMEHESFEDSTVAAVMNEHFVSVKVDREERPDIDQIYMNACQLASQGGCGWPLNAFALPDGKPFWAGTYFPKDQWLKLLERFQKMWEEEPETLQEFARQLTEGVKQNDVFYSATGEEAEFKAEALQGITEKMLEGIDFKDGGIEGSPKFPLPGTFEFLLAQHFLSGNEKAKEAVEVSLDKIALGGIYDQLGGGFARYSTDAEWIVPHFEKMLYDNGQLVSLYANAFKATQKELYKKVIEESLVFIQREMSSPEGGFYSSLDADSEGEEGKFYVWTYEELEQLITNEEDMKLFSAYYEISRRGNWEEEKNILYRRKTSEELAKKFGISPEEVRERVGKISDVLFETRQQRVRPGLDDKILTSWNALMLKGYVDAYHALGRAEYLETAIANANFLFKNMMEEDGRLWRNFKNGKSSINAFLDDYALLTQAFIALYQATFEEEWLQRAKKLMDYAILHFSEEESGLFFYTSDIDPPLVARQKEMSDNVIPSSNAIMANNLQQLGQYFYDQAYLERAKKMIRNVQEILSNSPQPRFFYQWARLYQQMVYPSYEVAIVGEEANTLRSEMMANYLPHALFLGGKTEGSLQLLEDKLSEGETFIYVCQNKVCKLPVTEARKALELMPVIKK
jgi:uncharacterized protein YyaL (SSP411 family)